MKSVEVLAALPQWENLAAEKILSSPAWAMPCRIGDTQCTMRLDAVRPAETLDIAVRFEGEDSVLCLADTPAFPELHAIWSSRADVPEPVLLAIVEKDCGGFLQMLENAVRRRLEIKGLAHDTDGLGEQTAFAQVVQSDAESSPIVFGLQLTKALVTALGQLRYLDTGHDSIRDTPLQAEVEYASFVLPEADVAALAPGDALIMPEVGTVQPRICLEGRLVISESGVAPWQDDGCLRICAADAPSVTAGAVLDAAQGNGTAPAMEPGENAQLKLVRKGKTLARGFFGSLAGQKAFIAEST